MNAPTIPTRPLTIGDLLDWTIRLYRSRFGKMILTTALFLVPIGLVSGIINGQTMTGYLNVILALIQNPEVFPEDQFLNVMGGRQDVMSTIACLIIPFSLIATGMSSLALTYHALNTLHNRDATIMESVKVAWHRFWSWLGMSIVMGIAFFGLLIAIIILLGILFFMVAFMGGFFGALDTFPAGDGIAAGIGVICGVICIYGLVLLAIFGPLAYFSGRWAVAIPGIVDQRWGAVESLQESWALTRNHAWRAIWFMVLVYLLYAAIYIAVMALAFSLSAAVVNTSSLGSIIVFAVTGTILPVLWQPIPMAAQVMLYYDLRIRNESYDLEVQISQLEDEVRPDEPAAF